MDSVADAERANYDPNRYEIGKKPNNRILILLRRHITVQIDTSTPLQTVVGFYSRFPVSKPHQQALASLSSIRSMNTSPHQPFRVLITDDDPAAAEELAEQVRAAGHYVCDTLSNATSAIAAVANKKPDIVVMDIDLSDDNEGVKTVMQMRRAHNVPIVFLSATDDESTLHRVLSISPSGYLVKPVQARDLKVTLELALRRHQRETAERQSLQSLAQTDPLTGLSNRRHLDQILTNQWNLCRTDGRPLGVLMIDIDHFKQFNDAFGHVAGDLCLTRVAEALQAARRHPAETIGRWGGEEFLLILPDSNAQATQQTAESVMQAVRESGDASTQILGQQPVTISVGVAAACPPSFENDPSDLVHLADTRLYTAKRTGRNRVISGPPLTNDMKSNGNP